MSWLMQHFAATAAACTRDFDTNFLFFPTWYKYLPAQNINNVCTPKITSINDTWLVVAALVEILVRIGALMAVAFVIYGGFQYMVSQGEPDKTAKARSTIINAVVGLGITVLAAAIISFIAGSIN